MMNRGVLLFVTCLLFSSGVIAQPKIEIIGGNKFAFGNVFKGKKVEHKIVVKNTGNELLELGRIDVSCGCTGAVVSNSAIPPGKTGDIVITFNSTNFSGPVTKAVTSHSNSTNDPAARFEFTATVIQELAFNPQQFWFKDAEVGRVSTATITVTNNGAEPVMLTGYNTGQKELLLRLPKGPIAPGKSADVVAELKAKAAVQVLNDNITIQTTSKNEPNIFVRVFGTVKEFKFQ